VIRTQPDPLSLASAVRQRFQALDRAVPIYGLNSMEALMDRSVASRRLQLWLVAVFGALALLLACIGIYGAVAYVVAQRGPEIGIRMAMGASSADVVRMMARKGFTPVLIGLAIGLALSLGFSQLLSSQLYQVEATDTLTFSLVPLLLCVTAGLAAYVPSRRASRIDPMLALRHE
jgi:ABC-type antimicrobial peptide transport system permease subunit